MQFNGFDVPRNQVDEAGQDVIRILDKNIDNPERTVLQIILTWDEYAAVMGLFSELAKAKHPVYSAWNDSNLPSPGDEYTHVGAYRDVDVYVEKVRREPKAD